MFLFVLNDTFNFLLNLFEYNKSDEEAFWVLLFRYSSAKKFQFKLKHR